MNHSKAQQGFVDDTESVPTMSTPEEGCSKQCLDNWNAGSAVCKISPSIIDNHPRFEETLPLTYRHKGWTASPVGTFPDTQTAV
jgi:hypothetical protein